jgi:hypothetical protein
MSPLPNARRKKKVKIPERQREKGREKKENLRLKNIVDKQSLWEWGDNC